MTTGFTAGLPGGYLMTGRPVSSADQRRAAREAKAQQKRDSDRANAAMAEFLDDLAADGTTCVTRHPNGAVDIFPVAEHVEKRRAALRAYLDGTGPEPGEGMPLSVREQAAVDRYLAQEQATKVAREEADRAAVDRYLAEGGTS